MDIYSVKKSGTIKSDPSAVGFYYDGSLIFHLGLLFLESPNEDAKLLHLYSHHSLRTNNIDQRGFWIRLGLTDRQVRQLAGMCAMISKRNSTDAIAFSIVYDSNRQYFDKNGNYIPSGLGEGLTCATFVMAIFENLGLPLLLTDTWTSETKDEVWHLEIMEQMKQSSPDPTHFKAMASNVGCARYRPADIVIASSKKQGRPLPQKTVRRAYGALCRKVKGLAT